jgi:periplasmic protein TonB
MPATRAPSGRGTAHDRFKRSFWSYVWAGVTLSAVAHFAVLHGAAFEFVDDYAVDRRLALEQIELPLPEFEIPPPPSQISRPAIPVVSTDLDFPDDITISEVSFDRVFVEDLPPPPITRQVDVSEEPAFTPYEVRPRLQTPRELETALLRHYPSKLKNVGIGGVVVLWVFIDETGEVRNTRVVESTGYQALDDAAEMAVREAAKFSPAMNRDDRVAVWIQLPITFIAQV